MKTILSDMRPFGIFHRIQLATHAKSSLPHLQTTESSAEPLGLSAWLPLRQVTVQPITSILFAFVFLGRNDAVFDGIGVHGTADPVENCEPESEPGAGDRSKARESQDN